jgi:hypothetical protein
MFDDDCRAVPVPELRRPLELAEQDERLLATLAARLQLEPAAVVRVALLTLAQPPRGRRWA